MLLPYTMQTFKHSCIEAFSHYHKVIKYYLPTKMVVEPLFLTISMHMNELKVEIQTKG